MEKEQPQIILKLPNKRKYVARLKKMVRARKGKVDVYVLETIDCAADIKLLLDKLNIEIHHSPSVVRTVGSTGQDKSIINPLIPEYNKLQKTYFLYLKSLGGNFDIDPDRVAEATPDVIDDALKKIIRDNE